MKIRIQHRTTYSYSEPVKFGQHRIMIRPREGHDVHIESSVLDIRPAHTIRWMRDVNGNSLAKVDFTEPSDTLTIYSELVLSQYDTNPFDFILEDSAVQYPFVYDPDSLPELSPFMAILYPRDAAALRTWLEQFWKPGDKIQTFALLQKLNEHIYKTFKYQRRDAPGVQTPAETLQKNSGSCRDFATLMLEACRCWGLAARFASGYMHCEATEAGGASTHAWTEVYLPGAGWKGFDPTSNLMTGANHVTVAVSRNPENAAPIAGTYEGTPNAFKGIEVDVTVVQIDNNTKISAPPAGQAQSQQLPSNPTRTTQPVQQAQQQNAPPVMEMVIPQTPPTSAAKA